MDEVRSERVLAMAVVWIGMEKLNVLKRQKETVDNGTVRYSYTRP
jgi:hypothetical protein